MKKPILLIIAFLAISATSLFAQEVIKLESCQDPALQKQADSIKQVFTNSGYIVLREASVAMESEYEQPVVVPMQEGGLYHFVFIGDQSSKLFEVRMYDWEEKEVVYKRFKRDLDGNLIDFQYVPKGTQYHMIKPVQVNSKKKKGLCGYVILFKKVKA